MAIIGTGGLAATAIIGTVMLLGAGGGLLGESIYSMDASRAVTGAITSGSPNVFINDKPAARAHIDKGSCNRDSPVPQIIAQGSCSVFINGMHAARKSDAMTCGALINDGSPNVFIGGDKFTTDDISPEVPTWLNNTLMVVALAGATILLRPAVAILGLTFSVIGGEGGKVLSHLCGFKKGSDGEKWFQIAGSILGGAAGGKLGGGLPKGVVVADEVVQADNAVSNFENAAKAENSAVNIAKETATFKPSVEVPKDPVTGYTKSSLKLGREVHAEYKADWEGQIQNGFDKEFVLDNGRRVDAIDFNSKTVYELKANNPKQIKLGVKQAQGYIDELNRMGAHDPEIGTGWKYIIDTY